MKKMMNSTIVSGYIYECRLDKKVTSNDSKHPGTEFISGFLDIATDNACENIVSVHYTYAIATTASGKPNATFGILNNIINGNYKTIMRDGKENATKVTVSSNIGLNEWYDTKGEEPRLVSTMRNEGGFINVIDNLDPEEKKRNTFRCDMIINQVRHMDADPERNLPEKAIIHGVIFDFRNAILPVDFSVVDPRAIDYFEDQNISNANPFFTQVWGNQVSTTIVRENHVSSAFGEDYVTSTTSSRKEWIITGATTDPYEWDTEETITAKELSEAMANREVYLAGVKKRQDDYQASKNSSAANIPNKSAFNF